MPNLYFLLVTFIFITGIYSQDFIFKENERVSTEVQPQYKWEISVDGRFLTLESEEESRDYEEYPDVKVTYETSPEENSGQGSQFEPQVSQEDPQEVRVSYDDNEEESPEQSQMAPEVYPEVIPRSENSEGYPVEDQEESEISEENQENYEGENEFEMNEEHPEETRMILTIFGDDPEQSDNEAYGEM